MARGLQNYPNIEDQDSDFPDGRIKDNTGANDGTPINEFTNGDLQQFFAKILRAASIVANGLPESEYIGHQYYQAILKLINLNPSAGVIETNEQVVIKQKLIQLGAWNMDADATKAVAHGLNPLKILRVSFSIIDDAQVSAQPLDRVSNAVTIDGYEVVLLTGNVLSVDATNVNARRSTGGVYDNAAYSSILVNRGHVLIDYYE